jgi:hypothetical protein
VTLIDVSVPMMILRAADIGKTGYETPAELDADRAFFARLEALRARRGGAWGSATCRQGDPKVAILAPPRTGGAVAARYFVPHKTHAAFAVTGGLCVATCAVLAGSVSDGSRKAARGRRPHDHDRAPRRDLRGRAGDDRLRLARSGGPQRRRDPHRAQADGGRGLRAGSSTTSGWSPAKEASSSGSRPDRADVEQARRRVPRRPSANSDMPTSRSATMRRMARHPSA